MDIPYNEKNLLANIICGVGDLVDLLHYFDNIPKLNNLGFSGESYHDEEMCYILGSININGRDYDWEEGEKPEWLTEEQMGKINDTGRSLLVTIAQGEEDEDLEININREDLMIIVPHIATVKAVYDAVCEGGH